MLWGGARHPLAGAVEDSSSLLIFIDLEDTYHCCKDDGREVASDIVRKAKAMRWGDKSGSYFLNSLI